MPDKSKIEEPFSFSLDNGKSSTVYLVGIGGIGMSALARFFKSRGAKVSGYDKTPTSLTQELESEGIPVHFEENLEKIPKQGNRFL